MTVTVDEAMVRQFLEIISTHAVALARDKGRSGVLQLCCLSPVDERMIPHRFQLDDVDSMVETAVSAADAGLNVYVEARTVRADLRGAKRGTLADTGFVFGLVVDSDTDKGKAGTVTARPSLTVETSPGNAHLWYLFSEPVASGKAKLIGDAMRASTGADGDTGVVTQGYRVAGTPNYPSKTKRARGRVTVETTRVVEHTGRLWDPDEQAAAFAVRPADAARPTEAPAVTAAESSLPDDFLQAIRKGGVSKGLGAKKDTSQSGLFHRVVGDLKKRKWSIEQIHALLDRYPEGVAAKYRGRLRREVERSYDRVENGAGAAQGAASAGPAVAIPPGFAPGPGPPVGGSGGSGGGPPPPPPPGTFGPASFGPTPGVPPQVLPTIRLREGQLPRVAEETEKAVVASGAAIFARAGSLVYPVAEAASAARGKSTITARLSEFSVDSFIEPVAESAIFQRYNHKRQQWVDIDPPLQLVRMTLTRERRWKFPRVAGVITTPTLRADGSLLAVPGYDPRTELYLCLGLSMPAIPQNPTKEQALEALKVLKDLFDEFTFRRKAIDLSVALVGLLTALLRGSLPTAPVILVRADTPGTGKSYLVDVIAAIAIGRLCPVITASRNSEETEKRIGAVLLAGSAIVSLDNAMHDLGGELLCQLAERPIVRVRILGRSEMPDCECHTTVFATGNNIGFKGDMVRRGLLCELEALEERPELREFRHDALGRAQADRGTYVAAALTLVRAYLSAGAPRVCGPFGSYGDWSRMVRSPLLWLGEPDPCDSIETVRVEDPELSNIREFFALWPDYLRLDHSYTTARILEMAEENARQPAGYSMPELKNFLLKVAATGGKADSVSPERLGWWLRRISGRVVGKQRLIMGRDRANVASFRLVAVS